jgi:hypothetical protein
MAHISTTLTRSLEEDRVQQEDHRGAFEVGIGRSSRVAPRQGPDDRGINLRRELPPEDG